MIPILKGMYTMQKLYPDDSLTLHTDMYQINMMQTYFELGRHNLNVY